MTKKKKRKFRKISNKRKLQWSGDKDAKKPKKEEADLNNVVIKERGKKQDSESSQATPVEDDDLSRSFPLVAKILGSDNDQKQVEREIPSSLEITNELSRVIDSFGNDDTSVSREEGSTHDTNTPCHINDEILDFEVHHTHTHRHLNNLFLVSGGCLNPNFAVFETLIFTNKRFLLCDRPLEEVQDPRDPDLSGRQLAVPENRGRKDDENYIYLVVNFNFNIFVRFLSITSSYLCKLLYLCLLHAYSRVSQLDNLVYLSVINFYCHRILNNYIPE